MHTKVFCPFDYVKIVVANFQIQVFILTFETVLFLLGGDKHGMSFRNIQGNSGKETEGQGKRIIQCMERINERCSARVSLGTPSIQHIY